MQDGAPHYANLVRGFLDAICTLPGKWIGLLVLRI